VTQHHYSGLDVLMIGVSRSHSDTQNSVGLPGRVISLSHLSLPDKTQHSQETEICVPGGIPTHNSDKRAAADPGRRLGGHWYRRVKVLVEKY